MALTAVDNCKAELMTEQFGSDVHVLQKSRKFFFFALYRLDGVQAVNLLHSHTQVLYKPIVLCFPCRRRRTDC